VAKLLEAEPHKAIASSLGIAPRTVRFHLSNVRRKLRVASSQAVVIFFARHPVTDDSCQK